MAGQAGAPGRECLQCRDPAPLISLSLSLSQIKPQSNHIINNITIQYVYYYI